MHTCQVCKNYFLCVEYSNDLEHLMEYCIHPLYLFIFLIKLPKVIAFTVQQCSIVLFSVFGITSIVSHAIVNKQ